MKVDSMQRLEIIHSQSLTCSLQLDGPSTDRANIVLIMVVHSSTDIDHEGLET